MARSGKLSLVVALSALVLIGLSTATLSQETLPPLASVGPWKYATAPILYRDRLWFVNANRWPDHNSADVWSMRLDGSDLKRERRLFSQDVGRPIVHRGLLYWPHEDPRVSLGWGEISVTDGQDWHVLQTRMGRQFHLHGLYQHDTTLYAAGSAWSAQILSSQDRGMTWSQRYERKREEKRFSRTYQLVPTRDGLFGDIIEFGNGPRSFAMLLHQNGEPRAVPDWPAEDGLLRRAVAWQDGALALLGLGQAQQLRLMQADRFSDIDLPPGVTAIDIDVADDIWLLAEAAPKQHQIWRRKNGQWGLQYGFEADEAVELRLIQGAPVVAGRHQGQGVIWGGARRKYSSLGLVPRVSDEGTSAEVLGTSPRTESDVALPTQITPIDFDRSEALHQIKEALADPRNYRGHGLGLRKVLDKWVMRGLAGLELEPLLTGPFPEGEKVRLIGGRAHATHARFGRWLLTWAMRRSGRGQVPLSWLKAPFDEPENASQKYFSEPLAAIWTAAATGQNDAATRLALRQRLERMEEPAWLRIDARMALQVLDAR